MPDNGTALWISFASAAISATALGWNIYRDILARPRVKIQVSPCLTSEDGKACALCLSFTNIGPAPISISSIAAFRRNGLFRIRKTCGFMITTGIRFRIITSGKERSFETLNPLPVKMDIGDCLDLFLNSESAEMICKSWERVGVCDSTGRRILCSRRALRKAVKLFLSYNWNN